jgi:endonuclease/exonuclease/phosphatase family metal-dependent hydrolase
LGNTIRILSANLWNGAADPEGFAALATRLQADVVAVQELAAAQAEALAAVFPHGHLDPRDDFNGGGIASARPAEVTRLPIRRRDGFRAELSPEHWPELHAPLEIYGVHLDAPHTDFGLGLLRRRPQYRDLARHLDAPYRAGRVVVGDFNATPSWPLYWRMSSRMQDAALMVARRRGERPARTWGPWPGAPRLLRIDHGFLAGVEAESFRIVEIPGSDHSAVLLDVALTPAP